MDNKIPVLSRDLGFFRLDEDHRPVPCRTMEEWEDFERADGRRVALDVFFGPIRVSTVFLPVNHGFMGPPQWFESMVFWDGNARWNLECRRYATWEEAEIGHREMVELVRAEWEKKA